MTADAADAARGLDSYRTVAVTAPATPTEAFDQFVRGAVLGHAIFAVVGTEGIAVVPSPSMTDRPTYLFWSHQAEAERWADALVEDPQVVAIDLQGFLAETVPAMAAAGACVGVDWSAEPIEAEVEPHVLGAALREDMVRAFAASVVRTRFVWVLETSDGIASVNGLDGGQLTPVWADRHTAEHVRGAIGRDDVMVARRALLDLTNRYLLSPVGLKARMAPAYVHAREPLLMSPWAFKALINGGGQPNAVRMAVA